MNRIRHIRRLAAALTGLAGALLASAMAAPAALARPVPPLGFDKYPPPLPPEHAVAPVYNPAQAVAGGMPGWAIVLIAVGAALLAAVAAVLADRAWADRRKAITPAA